MESDTFIFSSEKLVACIYLSELESLHISQSEEAFIKSNKEALVKGLWRNHSHEPQVKFSVAGSMIYGRAINLLIGSYYF